ncbi:MAG: GDCCVxC domain-containing (seleno)protein [Gammaproteobacteria bacterium]|nr:GDCCVxC domain-containing (seleno)protein [Gammaproteobacteria bacterium]
MPQLKATLACPYCHHRQELMMPTDACLSFWPCERCEQMIKPLPGDCCVFCSYSDQKCPPEQ